MTKLLLKTFPINALIRDFGVRQTGATVARGLAAATFCTPTIYLPRNMTKNDTQNPAIKNTGGENNPAMRIIEKDDLRTKASLGDLNTQKSKEIAGTEKMAAEPATKGKVPSNVRSIGRTTNITILATNRSITADDNTRNDFSEFIYHLFQGV